MSKVRLMRGGLLRILCAFALLSLAFAHKPPQVMAAAYASVSLQLPDGSFADMCIGDTATKHPLVRQYCEVCALSSTALLPPPAGESWLLSQFADLANDPVTVTERPAVLTIERPRSRAPPVIS